MYEFTPERKSVSKQILENSVRAHPLPKLNFTRKVPEPLQNLKSLQGKTVESRSKLNKLFESCWLNNGESEQIMAVTASHRRFSTLDLQTLTDLNGIK